MQEAVNTSSPMIDIFCLKQSLSEELSSISNKNKQYFSKNLSISKKNTKRTEKVFEIKLENTKTISEMEMTNMSIGGSVGGTLPRGYYG